MKFCLKDLGWVIVVSSSIAIVGAIFVGIKMELSKSDWAAWVQGVGTILAVFAAIWVASREDRRRRAESLASSRLVAACITMQVAVALASVRQVKDQLTCMGQIDFEQKVLAACIVDLRKVAVWSVAELLVLVSLPRNTAYRIAGGVDRLNAAIFVMQNFVGSNGSQTPANRRDFAQRMGSLLAEACELFSLAVVDLQNESFVLTSPFNLGPDSVKVV